MCVCFFFLVIGKCFIWYAWGVMEELILGSHGDVLAGGDSFQCDTVEVFRLFSGAVGVTGEEGQGCFPG